MAEGVDDGVEGVGVEEAGEVGGEVVIVVVVVSMRMLVLGVVDDFVGSEAFDHAGVSTAADAHDEALGTDDPAGHLHDHGADAAAGRVDEDAVAGPDAGLDDELVCRHAG